MSGKKKQVSSEFLFSLFHHPDLLLSPSKSSTKNGISDKGGLPGRAYVCLFLGGGGTLLLYRHNFRKSVILSVIKVLYMLVFCQHCTLLTWRTVPHLGVCLPQRESSPRSSPQSRNQRSGTFHWHPWWRLLFRWRKPKPQRAVFCQKLVFPVRHPCSLFLLSLGFSLFCGVAVHSCFQYFLFLTNTYGGFVN